jgi:hypothetical protein
LPKVGIDFTKTVRPVPQLMAPRAWAIQGEVYNPIELPSEGFFNPLSQPDRKIQ